jgi:ABC-type Fe3+/spermidine/putrescine transport system ATPase subunit
MRFEILELQRKLGITTVFVTHDQEEAMVLSDEVLVMEFGKVIQRGDPEAIYFDPSNEFVADFIGKINFLNGTITQLEESASVVGIEEEGFRSEIHSTRTNYAKGQKVLASVRPENIQIHTSKPDQEINTWPAKLIRKNFLGGMFDMAVGVQGKELRARTPFKVEAKSGADVFIHIPPKDVLLIDRN